jgi:hypothetical protein
MGERAGLTWDLPLPLYCAVAVDNADRRFGDSLLAGFNSLFA